MREMVGPYRILSVVGRGGMGIVYRGIHDNLGRKVAIKALAPELTQQPQFRERFFSEARTQAQLQHPNIVTIYDLLEDGGEYFIIMELVEGRGLDELLAERAGVGLGTPQTLAIMAQVLAALDTAHSQGVIHRDVKASNVLVTRGGQVKLMDFGIALLIGDKRLTQSSQTIGTPVYMSPEQILRPKEVDHRTDIYSAAVMLYEMLAGRPPFDAATEYEIKKQHIETQASDLAALVAGVAPDLSRAIGCALSKDPDDRFGSAGEFLRALKAAVPDAFAEAQTDPQPASFNAAPTPAVPRTVPAAVADPRPSAASRRGGYPSWLPAAAGAGVLALIVLMAGGLYWLGSGGPAAPDEESSTARVETVPPATPTISTVSPVDRAVTVPPPSAVAADPPPEVPVETEPAPPPPKAPPPPPPSPPPPRRDTEEEIRKRTIARVRDQVKTGITQIEAHLKRGDFDLAQREVKTLVGLSSPYRADLVDEVVELRLLEGRITDERVAARMEVQQRENWERRIMEIRNLSDQKKYPEAKNLARNLLDEDGVPADIATQARSLIEAADRGLKEIFKSTEWQEDSTEIENETKKQRRKRKKDNNSG